MNDLTYPRVVFPLRKLLIIFVAVFGLLAILGTTLTQQTQAGFDCSGNSWAVGNEADLNSAVACYNSQTTADEYTIAFTQNITLTDSTMPISNTINVISLLIEGAGFVIDGQDILSTLPFFIHSNTKVSMQNIIITGGEGYDLAGGIQNEGDLTLINTIITGNYSDRWGGGIYNYWGKLTITNSIISNNSARDFYGGGIYNQQGTVTIHNSSITGNSMVRPQGIGGGIRNEGTLIINDSTFLNNDTSPGGPGAGISSNGVLTINNTTFSNNGRLGSAIHNSGDAYINQSIFNGNSGFLGGAIRNVDGGTIKIMNSILNNNTAAIGGGGIYHSSGIVNLNNSTISGNIANIDGDESGGGGIFNYDGTVELNSSTLNGNSANLDGGGIHNISGTITISNSIVANSNAPNDCVNDSGTILDNGHNLVEDNSCGFTGGSDPLLGPLQDNGGPTFTHLPLPGSPAINAGETTLTTDQRGVSRPQGAADDIGAVEVYNRVYLPFIIK